MTSEPVLNLATWVERSVVNGPGERFVIWVQGCPIHCLGCINPELWPIEPRRLVPIGEMANLILSTQGIEGITISGGEPTLQVEALLDLIKILKERGLTVLCYSGYCLDELRARDNLVLNEFLENIDILIDGPFLETDVARLPLRGSRNQCIHHLSPVYKDREEEFSEHEQQVELINSRTDWKITGIWEDHFLLRLKELLASESFFIESNDNFNAEE